MAPPPTYKDAMSRSLEPAGQLVAAAVVLSCALLGGGCAPSLGGDASFPIVSRTTLPGYYEPITTVDEKRCTHAVPLVAWGDDANHEALVTDILSQHKGDAIIDAKLTFFQVPALVYHQYCARVTGTVVRRSEGAGASGPPPVKAATPAPSAPSEVAQ
jgi:hypothetical protein